MSCRMGQQFTDCNLNLRNCVKSRLRISHPAVVWEDCCLVLTRDAQGKRVGVLGLGVGTLAAYGREQDVYRFYEINPEVVDLAEGKEGYFTYISNSLADIDIILGDARLSLERELQTGQAQAYDVLILDVFSGDAPPVHLLTAECFSLYLEHLAPDGVIAANVSTSHINLTPLLSRVSEAYDLQADPHRG